MYHLFNWLRRLCGLREGDIHVYSRMYTHTHTHTHTHTPTLQTKKPGAVAGMWACAWFKNEQNTFYYFLYIVLWSRILLCVYFELWIIVKYYWLWSWHTYTPQEYYLSLQQWKRSSALHQLSQITLQIRWSQYYPFWGCLLILIPYKDHMWQSLMACMSSHGIIHTQGWLLDSNYLLIICVLYSRIFAKDLFYCIYTESVDGTSHFNTNSTDCWHNIYCRDCLERTNFYRYCFYLLFENFI